MNIILLMFIAALTEPAGYQNTSIQNSLDVQITNVVSLKGKVHVGLFNNAATFPDKGKALIEKEVVVKNNELQLDFSGLADGLYAIALYHDVNNNNAMDKNFFGIPTEPYGFSNNIRHAMSAPAFMECSFVVKAGSCTKISIRLS